MVFIALVSNIHALRLSRVYTGYTAGDQSLGHPLKQNNFLKIGPNHLSFFEKLEGLVCWVTCFGVFKKIAVGRRIAREIVKVAV